jgi:predicted phage baseplate assembly protein
MSGGSQAAALHAPPLAGTVPPLRPGMVGIAGVAVVDADSGAGTPPRVLVTLEPDNAVDLAPWLLQSTGYVLTGGARLHPRVARVEASTGRAGEVGLVLDTEGDRSTYTVALQGPNADPFHDSATLRFRLDCQADADCAATPVAPAAPAASSVPVDYLARDFAAFRRALLDFLPTRVPGWTETSEADVAVMLLELFAATADAFSYVLDRVANEAFLTSATQRRSVAGHLALVGYALDQGASAATVLHLQVTRPHLLAAGFAVGGRKNEPSVVGQAPAEEALVFETVADRVVRPEHNEMLLYGWDSPDGYLPAGATTAYLAGDMPALAAGDVLALRDTLTGDAEIVRLAGVPERIPASAYGTPALTRVTWTQDTASRTEHPVARTVVLGNLVPATHGRTRRDRVVLEGASLGPTATQPPGATAQAIARPSAVAPGAAVLLTVWGLPDGTDVVLVVESPDGGQEHLVRPQDVPGGLDAAVVRLAPDAAVGTWRALVGVTAGEALTSPRASATWEVLIDDDAAQEPNGPPPRLRVPVPDAPLGVDAAGVPQLWATIDGVPWSRVASLLDSGPRERVFTLEFAEGGAAELVFGQGGATLAGSAFGLRPGEGAVVDLRYRVGLGVAGNVPADTLTVPLPDGDETLLGDWFRSVTNPVAAVGGREPESLASARRSGPAAARTRLVAVTGRDYVDAVADFDREAGGGLLSQAGAQFRWTGSWLGVELVLDLAPGVMLDDRLASDLVTFLDGRRLTGYDVRLLPARDLPLQLSLTVCVGGDFLTWPVRQAIAATLRPGSLPDSSRGFFDPENLSFGDPVVLSRLYLAVTSVPGVQSVTIDVLAPLHSATAEADTAAAKAAGQLTVGRDQIARLDDDPARPERGRLTLVMRGGR